MKKALNRHPVVFYYIITLILSIILIIPVIRVSDNDQLNKFIEEMKAKYPGFKTIGTTAHKENPLYAVDMTSPVMFMIGNETDGLNRGFRENCDVLTTIPMVESSSASSFNVGCAATVMFYEAARQRKAD